MTLPRILFGALAAFAVVAGAYLLRRGSQPPPTPMAAASAGTAAAPGRSEGLRPAPAAAPDDAPKAAATGNSPAASLIARIAALKVVANQPRNIRQLLADLEKLRELGPAALPALAQFLASGQDVDFDAGMKFSFKDGKVPTDFMVPPSLRLALLEVAKNIGGAESEALLARELKTTGRGVEAAYIAAALEQLAPGKHTSAATAAARDLLTMPLSSATTKNPLDRSDREYLYQILVAAGDRTQVAQAESQVLLPNGQIDRGALNYLQQALGPASLDVAMRAWNDPRVPPAQREPLVRLALTWVGADDRAEQFYQVAIQDPNLTPSARKNLVEDLNQDGFNNLKQLGLEHLPLIERRLAFIEKAAPTAKDPVIVAAFAEAKKDLLAMRDKARATPKK